MLLPSSRKPSLMDLPDHLLCRHVLPLALESGFLPGFSRVSRRAHALSVRTAASLLHGHVEGLASRALNRFAPDAARPRELELTAPEKLLAARRAQRFLWAQSPAHALHQAALAKAGHHFHIALRELNLATAVWPDCFSLQFELAAALFNFGDRDSLAYRAAAAADALAPAAAKGESALLLGKILLRQDRRVEAGHALNVARGYDAQMLAANLCLMELTYRDGRPNETLVHAAAILEVDGQHLDALLYHLDAMLALGRDSHQWTAAANSLVALQPQDVRVWELAACVAEAMDEHTRTIDCLRRALPLQPNQDRYNDRLASAYRELAFNEVQQGASGPLLESYLTLYLHYSVKNADNYATATELYLTAGNCKRAGECCRQGLHLNRNHPRLRVLMQQLARTKHDG